MLNKALKERLIESHLRYFETYKIAIINLKKQLEYILPTLTTRYDFDFDGNHTFTVNDTEKVAIDRIESKRALDLHEEIKQYQIIVESIENAFQQLKPIEQQFVKERYFECLSMEEVTKLLGYAQAKSAYQIKKRVLDKLQISLSNLLVMK